MYKISVPVMNSTFKRAGRDKLVRQMKKIGAERVFLALNPYIFDEGERRAEFNDLKENCDYLKKAGFETGAWLWAFMVGENNDFMHMKSPENRVSASEACPSDKNFVKFAGEYIAQIAECGVDMIMYDDDFRYGFLDMGFGCVCENHIALISEKLGENVDTETLKRGIMYGGKNKYRSAWLWANKHVFENFAAKMRSYADKVNPKIRIGVCACISTWDADGTDSFTVSRVLAGKTKPFLRLIGAPYWAVEKSWGNRLQDVIELERMELSWNSSEDIEIFTEGDVFPRPRFTCPSAYLEGFDTAMRVCGAADGILKYPFDYVSKAGYENGYIDRHVKNENLYVQIDKYFKNKESCGVRVYETMKKLENMTIPEEVCGKTEMQELFFSPAARMLAACSVPTVYKGAGICGVAFGENIKYAEKYENGLIIDAAAAYILNQTGVDVGITEFLGTSAVQSEYFEIYDEYTNVIGSRCIKVKLNEKAKVQSWFISGKEKMPASYVYENENGERFAVFLFNAYFNCELLTRQYARSKQLADNVKWLSGHRLPAYSYGNPDLYIQCKNNDGSMAVGLWNFFADGIERPEIELGGEYKEIDFINCSGKMSGNKVYLTEMGPFSFAGFEVRK